VSQIAERKLVLVMLSLVLGLAGVACSSSSSSSSSSSGTSPASGGGGTTLEQGANGALVFAPKTLTVNKGTTITVANVGSTAHTFTVTDQNIDVENQQGQSQQVAIDLAPGTYPFICRFHVSEGMTGTLVVTG
jgi:plastocyanin